MYLLFHISVNVLHPNAINAQFFQLHRRFDPTPRIFRDQPRWYIHIFPFVPSILVPKSMFSPATKNATFKIF